MNNLLFLILVFLVSFYGVAESADLCSAADFSSLRDNTTTIQGCFNSKATGTPVQYEVTFPAGYPDSQIHSFPYAVFLHGRGGSGRQFSAWGGAKALDNYVRSGGTPFVVIAPTEPQHAYWKDGPNNEFGSTSMVIGDLIEHVESLAPGPERSFSERAIFGISMGGHGAVYIGCVTDNIFGQVYAISPVFRAEDELIDADRPAYGMGSDYPKQDPASIFMNGQASGQDCLPKRFRVEIGSDDAFLKSKTKDFLKLLREVRGQKEVDLGRPGKHDAGYWQGALDRAVQYLGDGFLELNPLAQWQRLLAPPRVLVKAPICPIESESRIPASKRISGASDQKQCIRK